MSKGANRPSGGSDLLATAQVVRDVSVWLDPRLTLWLGDLTLPTVYVLL
jgi:hypothetical protein